MTRTDGEHELVLGNKQLLSAFFVVVILLGVFFTMGYFVGKNTATAGFNGGQGPLSGGVRPDAAGKPLDSGSTAGSLPPDSTSPAVDPNAPETPVPSTPASPATTPPATPKGEAKPDAKTEFPLEAPPARTVTTAQSGSEEMYLQVSAIRRPDADSLAKVLSERGFPALLRESSKPGLYRVLVGPFKTNGEMGRAKSDLKAKGFESIVAK
jgi:cell division septation protein DedD